MVDAGTTQTTAQVLFLLGENATANQILEANTNYAILYAESLLYLLTGSDFVTNWASVDANLKQAVGLYCGATAALILINQNPNAWQLATTQDKKNTLTNYADLALKRIQEADIEW